MPPKARLEWAIQHKDHELVDATLTSSPRLATEPDMSGKLPLHQALAKRVNQEVVKVLIKHGADVNQVGDDEPPLVLALKTLQPSLVTLLLGAGANPNLPSLDGDLPLRFAMGAPAEGLRRVFVKQLFEAGANVNLKIDGSSPALQFAIEGGYRKVVEYLLTHTDASLTSPPDETALDSALFMRDPHMIELVLKAIKALKPSVAKTLIKVAKKEENLPVLKALGVDVSGMVKDMLQRTQGDLKLVELFQPALLLLVMDELDSNQREFLLARAKEQKNLLMLEALGQDPCLAFLESQRSEEELFLFSSMYPHVLAKVKENLTPGALQSLAKRAKDKSDWRVLDAIGLPW